MSPRPPAACLEHPRIPPGKYANGMEIVTPPHKNEVKVSFIYSVLPFSTCLLTSVSLPGRDTRLVFCSKCLLRHSLRQLLVKNHARLLFPTLYYTQKNICQWALKEAGGLKELAPYGRGGMEKLPPHSS